MNDTSDLAVEVQDLVWTLLDEQATDQQVCRLEELLRESNEARRIYVTCIQMHVDLQYLLGKNKAWRPKFAQLPLPGAETSMAACPDSVAHS